jgi:hypothetical protein
VIVTINGERLDVASSLGDGAGWVLGAEGDELELVGELCSAAQDGQFQAIELEVGRIDLPLLPGL